MDQSTDFHVEMCGDRNRKRLAAAALIGECEAIIECGLLPEQNEQALRLLIADALSAFGMQHHDERNAA
jgi:hypothetical protein